MNLQALLPLLLPRAIAWAVAIADDVVAQGRALSPAELSIASRVGVGFPERIRVLLVTEMPLPEDPQLAEAAQQAGLLGPGMDGLTLGYAILIRDGRLSRKLLSHECRHVYQYEEAGGIANFLPEYLRSVVRFGYSDSPFERDARAHEVAEA